MELNAAIPHKDELTEVLEVLKAVSEHVDAKLIKEVHQHHKLRIMTDINRLVDHISLVTGQGLTEAKEPVKLKQATTIAGKKIKFVGKKKEFDVTPEEDAISQLKARVDMAYPSFLHMDSKDIRKNVDDDVIRGVAKKAKMFGISKDAPAVIDIAFIDKVKLKIAENEQFRAEQAEQKKLADQKQADESGPDFDEMLGEGIPATSADAPESVGDIEKLQEDQVRAQIESDKAESDKNFKEAASNAEQTVQPANLNQPPADPKPAQTTQAKPAAKKK